MVQQKFFGTKKRFKVKNLYAIASKHPDAEIMARILKNWGYGLIRGSSKKRGKIVIQEMNEIFHNNGIIANFPIFARLPMVSLKLYSQLKSHPEYPHCNHHLNRHHY